jgi:hypothetical protein
MDFVAAWVGAVSVGDAEEGLPALGEEAGQLASQAQGGVD